MNGKRDEEFERQLVRRLAAGEPEAVEDLVHRYADDVYRFVFNRVGGSAQDAEDVVQETFIAALDAIGNFKGDSKLRTWLFSIASHKAIDQQRWFARRPEVDLQDKTFFLSADDPLPSQAFARFEVRQAVRRTSASASVSLSDGLSPQVCGGDDGCRDDEGDEAEREEHRVDFSARPAVVGENV